MKEISLNKSKIRDFLTERLTKQILQLDEHIVHSLIRYEGIGGYEKKSDTELFVQLVEAIPEFQLMTLAKADHFNLFITVKEENELHEDEILVDIQRAIQTKL
ncbi:MAG TPA: hypothetical protein VHO90_14505 [Bacteroidales bacterium]|nr:hypothetical protein [Bacteroidales bacterium]